MSLKSYASRLDRLESVTKLPIPMGDISFEDLMSGLASPFPFLIDPDRTAYQAYGLESSVLRSWSPANLWYYTKAVLQKRETFGKWGNSHQLGGDFIIDPQGIVRPAHPSREPTDRPPIGQILRVLREVRRGGRVILCPKLDRLIYPQVLRVY